MPGQGEHSEAHARGKSSQPRDAWITPIELVPCARGRPRGPGEQVFVDGQFPSASHNRPLGIGENVWPGPPTYVARARVPIVHGPRPATRADQPAGGRN